MCDPLRPDDAMKLECREVGVLIWGPTVFGSVVNCEDCSFRTPFQCDSECMISLGNSWSAATPEDDGPPISCLSFFLLSGS